MRTENVVAQRQQILTLYNAGRTPSNISKELGCSRTTVYKAIADTENAAVDSRTRNPGRPRLYDEVVQSIVRKLREETGEGGEMIAARLARSPHKFGLAPEDVPSPSLVNDMIHAWGLARKPIGPKGNRVFPDMKPTEPGTVTVDGWGPWELRGNKIYLATIQDRFTRLTGAIPASTMRFSQGDDQAQPGMSTKTWARALALAHQHLCPAGLVNVYSDNGVGMVPAFGTMALAARTALKLGAKLIFIPPGEPWRNGGLERWHWTMESGYWRQDRPASTSEALTGLRDWINYYNTDRPHASLHRQAPADSQPWFQPLPEQYWTKLTIDEKLPPQAGIVEAVRMVYNSGIVELWGGQLLQLQPLLAGQYVRLRFNVSGKVESGQVIYQQRKNQDILVARFNHTLDATGHGGPHWQLFHDVELLEFEGEVPPNQGLDQEREANRMSRVLKARSPLDRRRAEESAAIRTDTDGGL